MPNFEMWSQANLARLAAELYEENQQLRKDCHAILLEYRAQVVRADNATKENTK